VYRLLHYNTDSKLVRFDLSFTEDSYIFQIQVTMQTKENPTKMTKTVSYKQ